MPNHDHRYTFAISDIKVYKNLEACVKQWRSKESTNKLPIYPTDSMGSFTAQHFKKSKAFTEFLIDIGVIIKEDLGYEVNNVPGRQSVKEPPQQLEDQLPPFSDAPPRNQYESSGQVDDDFFNIPPQSESANLRISNQLPEQDEGAALNRENDALNLELQLRDQMQGIADEYLQQRSEEHGQFHHDLGQERQQPGDEGQDDGNDEGNPIN